MKKFMAALIIVLTVVGQFSVFGAEEEKIVTDLWVYTGNLYLSDWENGSIVVKDVKPVSQGEAAIAAAAEIEYTEVPAFDGNIRSAGGDWLDLKSLSWFLDMDVRLTVARLSGGELRVFSIVTE